MEVTVRRRKVRAILLRKIDADRVRGINTLGYGLEPVQVSDDEYFLPETILDSHYHAGHIPFLSTLPRCKVVIEDTRDPKSEFGSRRKWVEVPSIYVPDPLMPRKYVPNGTGYERPPKPQKGDWDEVALYESIGRALSAWEKFEQAFAALFEFLVGTSIQSLPAFRAYGAIISFSQRSKAVEVAADAFFILNRKNSTFHPLKAEFRDVLKLANEFAIRRNDIAHGIVSDYTTPKGYSLGVALQPPRHAARYNSLSPNERMLMRIDSPVNVTPDYAYTSAEVRYFCEKFEELAKRCAKLAYRFYR